MTAHPSVARRAAVPASQHNLYALIAARMPADRSACAIETHDGLYWSWADLDHASARIAHLLAALKLLSPLDWCALIGGPEHIEARELAALLDVGCLIVCERRTAIQMEAVREAAVCHLAQQALTRMGTHTHTHAWPIRRARAHIRAA